MTAALDPTGFVTPGDGTRLAYWRLGAGPPVVVVHGGLGSSLGWRPVAQRLAGHFEVFLYDRRGRGRSGDNPAHALEREIEDAEALLAIAGPGAALLAHSFGGAVALEVARRAQSGAVAAVAVYEPAVDVGGTIAPADIYNQFALSSDYIHAGFLGPGKFAIVGGSEMHVDMNPDAMEGVAALRWGLFYFVRGADAVLRLVGLDEESAEVATRYRAIKPLADAELRAVIPSDR